MKQTAIICGGSGSSKFARLFAAYSDNEDSSFEPFFIANVSDNYWFHGLYVCPDVDIIIHALSGQLDTSKGWGMSSDTFGGRDFLSNLSGKEWFSLGDRELSYCLMRTELLKFGWKLSNVTAHIARLLGVKYKIYPATDDKIVTYVRTQLGLMHLQEFWVKRMADPTVLGVLFDGILDARPQPSLMKDKISSAILCPANPVTSILPIISMKGFQKILMQARSVVAISPFKGSQPFSGPASKFMIALGMEPSSFGVAKLYSDFLKLLIIDESDDPSIKKRVKELGVDCISMNTTVDNKSDSTLAREILTLL